MDGTMDLSDDISMLLRLSALRRLTRRDASAVFAAPMRFATAIL
jgi:hypothetical protein